LKYALGSNGARQARARNFSFIEEDLAMYEPHYEEESGGGGGFVFGLLCGAALGAAIGLMFAPKAGSELRQTLYDSTGDIRKKATDAYGQASQTVNDYVAKGTQTVNDYVAKGKEAVDRGKQAYDNARESATEGNFGQAKTGGNGADFGRTTTGV
jgi:gas vesicle protein